MFYKNNRHRTALACTQTFYFVNTSREPRPHAEKVIRQIFPVSYRGTFSIGETRREQYARSSWEMAGSALMKRPREISRRGCIAGMSIRVNSGSDVYRFTPLNTIEEHHRVHFSPSRGGRPTFSVFVRFRRYNSFIARRYISTARCNLALRAKVKESHQPSSSGGGGKFWLRNSLRVMRGVGWGAYNTGKNLFLPSVCTSHSTRP